MARAPAITPVSTGDALDRPPRPGLPRAVEWFIAATGLVLLSPLLVGCALAVRLTSRGPAFFRQQRVGRMGRLFTLLKFRTMRVGESGPSVTSAGDPRITAVGRFLRGTKLDEVPALWNVLRGEMAIVGPRPEVPQYVDLEDARWRAVLEARPGITDPVSVRLRSEERLLAGIPGDRETFYRTALVAYKLEGYLGYLSGRTWGQDLRVLRDTFVAVVAPGRVPATSADEVLRAASRGRP